MPKGKGGYSGMSSKSRWSGSVDSRYRRLTTGSGLKYSRRKRKKTAHKKY